MTVLLRRTIRNPLCRSRPGLDEWSSGQSGGNDLGEFAEIAQVIQCNTVDNRPVDFFVMMHGDIPKAHDLLELLRWRFVDNSSLGQRIECLAHRIRRQNIQAGNEMCAKVHAQLHSYG